MHQRPRVVFFGTPAFAVSCLAALAEVADVVAVVAQPDKPAGRGNTLTPPPTRVWAEARGITVVQPAKLRDGSFAAWLRGQQPDVAVVVAYGRILPPDVLAIPRFGCVNVHASVLPRHRGAAPIQWAIMSGDTVTGVTLMQMDEGLDTGPMLSIRRLPIGPDETSAALFERLAALGASLLRDDLPRYLAGELPPVAQDPSLATLAPILTREHSRLDFAAHSAQTLHNQVRGLSPWPGTSTTLGTRRLIVNTTRLDDPPTVHGGAPGEIVAVTREALWVATREGLLGVTALQLEGKKSMSVRDFLSGHPVRVGTLLGQELRP
ncbi:MAG: methionyl-tRNA formyltransferase [Myxococcales bacterium]|nr:methionyl-tRNA formyltransferase [Myxococcales bacterium]